MNTDDEDDDSDDDDNEDELMMMKISAVMNTMMLTDDNGDDSGGDGDGDALTSRARDLYHNQEIPGITEYICPTLQVIPLTASVSVPTLRLSKEELDFGTCLVGQEKELQVVLTNPTESASEWVAVKGTCLISQ